MNASAPAGARPPRLRATGSGALVVGATVLAYLPALGGGFIWNDSDYVTAPALRPPAGLARIWTEPGATQQYYPLLHSFFWLQHRLWGDTPAAYHLVNLLLHAGAAVLFALVLGRLLAGAAGPRLPAGTAWLAALLFALHPVHVESVAWITEQKNTLSLVCYLAAALAYLRFEATRRPGAYAAALALFVASLLCKTVTATLPAALLVALWWRDGRLDWRRTVAPLLPWLALGAGAGLFSSWVEQTYLGAQGVGFHASLLARGLVASRAVWFYAAHLVWPFGLNFVYPRWVVDPAAAWQWLFPLGALAAGAGLWGLRRRTRTPLAVFLLFTGSLFPVLGFVNLYGARYSWVWDHWQYLADLAPLALAAGVLARAWTRVAGAFRCPGIVPAAALAAGLGALTWAHAGMFRDDETLYRATLARNPDCWMAHNNLGMLLAARPGGKAAAVAEYEAALQLNPDDAEAHNNLGRAWLWEPGRLDAAITQFEAALGLQPDYAEAHNNLGVARARQPGRLPDAIAEFQTALRLRPDFAGAHNNLGLAWEQVPGRLDAAIGELRTAVRLDPDYAEAHNNLGVALSQSSDRLDAAAAEFETALRLKPAYAEAHNNLGLAWAQLPGRMRDAAAQFEAAVRANPAFTPAWHNLGSARLQLGDHPAAAAAFREVLRQSPDDPDAKQGLARALAAGP
ncbi:MAG TPA: tetratricopeptide repeat protein [Opitutaceae bacterium]|nr:tetratricopeptide repeat protein [Opitutaceae bacterium]